MTDFDDETTITEITIQPDGRVFVFGTSRQMVDMMLSLDPHSPRLQKLLAHLGEQPSAAPAGGMKP